MWQVWRWPWQRCAFLACLAGAFGAGAFFGLRRCVNSNPSEMVEQSIRRFEDAADRHKKRLDALEQFVRKEKAP